MSTFETKDWNRIKDIEAKPNQVGAATRMAKLITDIDKCHRRWMAAFIIFGQEAEVTQIFRKRYNELKGVVEITPAPLPPRDSVKMTAKVSTGDFEAVTIKTLEKVETKMSSRPAIVLGTTQPLKGEEDPKDQTLRRGFKGGTVEVWETWGKQEIHIAVEGTEPRCRIGSMVNFHDESGGFLFGAKMVEWYNMGAQFGNPDKKFSYE